MSEFVNGDHLFEALLEQNKIYPSTPKSSMSAKFIYEDDRLSTNTVENYFEKIETDVVPNIKEIVGDIFLFKEKKIKFNDIKKKIESLLPIFIIFYYRSGALLAEFSSINKKDKIPLLSRKILNKRYINLLSNMIKNNYKLAIIESDNNFLMSDQYVSTASFNIKAKFSNISNRTMGLKETLILIPVCSNYYIVYWHSENNFLKENKINSLNSYDINKINYVIMNNSYQKCIASNEVVLKDLIADYSYSSPCSMFWGNDKTGFYGGAISKKEVFYNKIDKEAYDNFDLFYLRNGYKDLGRNDLCFCGSKKKFKNCHEEQYERLKFMLNDLKSPKIDAIKYVIFGANIIELPIDQWSGCNNITRNL